MTEESPQIIHELAGSIREFGGTLNSLDATAERLATEMEKQRQVVDEAKRRSSWAILVGVLVLIVLSTAAIVNAASRASSDRVLDALKDCTDPAGVCFQRARAANTEQNRMYVQLICDATPPERRRPPCPTQ